MEGKSSGVGLDQHERPALLRLRQSGLDRIRWVILRLSFGIEESYS